MGRIEVPVSIWELAHLDGSSIFVRHAITDTDVTYVFGPFLFLTKDEIEQCDGTDGPHNLLRAMEGSKVRAQQVSLKWVVENARKAFKPVDTDCIVLGDLLIPFSESGAVLADTSINQEKKADSKDWESPWMALCDQWGVLGLRVMNANLIEQMATPGMTH